MWARLAGESDAQKLYKMNDADVAAAKLESSS
jgi:hypothetical protein